MITLLRTYHNGWWYELVERSVSRTEGKQNAHLPAIIWQYQIEIHDVCPKKSELKISKYECKTKYNLLVYTPLSFRNVDKSLSSFTNTPDASWILILQFCPSSLYLFLPFGKYNSIACCLIEATVSYSLHKRNRCPPPFFSETVVSICLMGSLCFHLIWTHFSFLIALLIGSSFPRIVSSSFPNRKSACFFFFSDGFS